MQSLPRPPVNAWCCRPKVDCEYFLRPSGRGGLAGGDSMGQASPSSLALEARHLHSPLGWTAASRYVLGHTHHRSSDAQDVA